jgi:hypothetical protein
MGFMPIVLFWCEDSMKPFQRLLLATIPCGLMAPTAVSAQQAPSYTGMAAVNEYMNQQDLDRFRAWESQNQVTSINQFSDVKPTDWAFQALNNLIERYGCVAGYPDGTYRGKQAMTRYEAAALLNACLDRVTEVTDELRRLMDEFAKELTVIRGRLDKLDAKVGKLEAMQFSTTTKLQGQATFVLGGVSASGNSFYQGFNLPASNVNANGFNGLPILPNALPLSLPLTAANTATWYNILNPQNAAAKYNALYGATTFSYDVRLNLSTSFTGKDLLYTRLRSGNFNNAFNGNGVNLTRLDLASNGFGTGPGFNSSNVVGIDRLWYRFPSGKEFSFVVAARGRNTEILGANPSVYATKGADRILDFFSVHGAPGVYNKATGAGFGMIWQQDVKKGKPRFSFSASWIAPNGEIGQAYDGNPFACAGGVEGGLFANCSGGSLLTQLAYTTSQFNVSLAYRYGNSGSNFRSGTEYVASNGWFLRTGSSNSFALNSYWQPKKSGWLPSISGGWAINNLTNNANNGAFTGVTVNGLTGAVFPTYYNGTYVTQSQSWFVGLQWDDVINKGNSLGFAIGQPTFATSLSLAPANVAATTPLILAGVNTVNANAAYGVPSTTPQDGGVVIEAWYKWQVTDNISITPGVFWLSRPLGQATAGGPFNPPAPFTANAAGAITQAPLSAFTPANLAGNFTPVGTPDWTAGFGIFGALIQTVIRF